MLVPAMKAIAALRKTRLRKCTFGAFALAFSARLLHVSTVTPDFAPGTVQNQPLHQHCPDHDWYFAAQRWVEELPSLAEGAVVFESWAAQTIKDGAATLKDTAARLEDQQAALIQSANQAVAQLTEQKAAFVQAAGEQKAAFVQAYGQAAAQFADRPIVQAANQAVAQLTEQKDAFVQAAGEQKAAFVQAAGEATSHYSTQLADRLREGPAVLKAAAESVGKQQVALQEVASDTLAQLATWRKQKAALFAEGVAEGQAALADAAAQAVTQLSEQHATLREAVATAGVQLSERQAMLAQAASQAASQLQLFCFSCGQDALRQATAIATAQLAEHEMLLRESAALIATQLANLQATLSPSAGRIAAQLAELQQQFRELEEKAKLTGPATCFVSSAKGVIPCKNELVDEPPSQNKPFARPYLLAAHALLQGMPAGYDILVACTFLGMVVLCVWSTIHTILWGGGEDIASLSYRSFLQRGLCWFVHRVFLGWAIFLLSDTMAQAPFHINKYDAMSWPMWSTLLPLSTQLCFFVPAATLLNQAVARGSRCFSELEARRFYASLSREVHASLVGCFVSDWLLFPTDIVFFGHHVIGLGIIFGVWSLVLKEARLMSSASQVSTNSFEARNVTAMSFWWMTGLAVASMEASSFFYNLYSVMSFGAVLNISLFAVFTYSNLLSLMCLLSCHPWGTSMKGIWAAGTLLTRITEWAQATFPQITIPWWLSSKTTSDSVSYLWKCFMISVLCLARHHQMWQYVREQLSSASAIAIGATCALLAAASVWRLKDFERAAVL